MNDEIKIGRDKLRIGIGLIFAFLSGFLLRGALS